MKKLLNTTIIIGALLSILGVVFPLAGWLITPQSQGSVGIIGGAGFPTLELKYLFWQRSFYFTITRFGLAILICGVIARIFNKAVGENCTVKSSLLALGQSASLACGLCCFAAAIRTHITEKTLTNICGEIGLFISLVVSLVILGLYIFLYFKDKKYKRIIFDALITILFFGAFLALGNNIYDLLSNIF